MATIAGMAVQNETLQVSGIRCERCVMRLGGVLGRLDGIEFANATLMGQVMLSWDDSKLEREQIVSALVAGGFRPLELA